METRGRKPTYNDPNSLRQKVEEYFEDCARKCVFPDYAGMRRFCKLSKKMIDDLQSADNPNCEDYIAIFEDAADRRESLLMRKMVTDHKAAQGCLNALKQKENGGYTDRPAENKEATLNVKIIGGHGSELFK